MFSSKGNYLRTCLEKKRNLFNFNIFGILRSFLCLVLIIVNDFSFSNNNETNSVLKELAKNFQQVSTLIETTSSEISEDKTQAVELIGELRERLLEIDIISSDHNNSEACGEIERLLLGAKTSIILISYKTHPTFVYF